MARERLPVTIVIAANHRYGILQTELTRAEVPLDQSAVARLTRLDNPRADWTALAAGYGVPAVRVETPAAFAEALRRGGEGRAAADRGRAAMTAHAEPVAIVTGGSGDIGRAVAAALARTMQVVVTARRAAPLGTVAGARIHAHPSDALDQRSVDTRRLDAGAVRADRCAGQLRG